MKIKKNSEMMLLEIKSAMKAMTRTTTLLGALTLSLFFTGCKDDENTAPTLKGANIKTHTTFGKILTDKDGKTLYFFSNDFGTTSTCAGGCVTAWPIFHETNITVGDGLDIADFGEIDRADGTKQTTYKGWPLYYYQGDANTGDVDGDKVNDVWYVAKPDYSVMVANQNGELYLVAQKGRTVYTFAQDGENTSACTAEPCITNWPVFFNANENVPSIFAKTDFGSFTRPDGSKQSTFKNKPLYYYKNDLVKGDDNGQGLNNGAWLKVDETRF